MTLGTAFLVGAIGLGHTSAASQTVRVGTGEPIVHVGVIVHRPDGGLGAAATSTGEQVGADMAGTVYLAPCASVGAANPGRPVSASATEVWQLSGSILELTPEQASVQIGWQRIRRGGREEASAPQSVTLTLKRGERVTLENITVPPAGSCEAAYASLSVLLATRGEFFRVNGTSSASNAASGGSAGTKVFTGSRGGLTSIAAAPAGQLAPTTLVADLWLVRTTPGRADETLHVTSPVVSLPRPFAFAPLTIQTASGEFTVKVEGTVEAGLTPEGERRFYFMANRTMTFAPTNRAPRDAAPIVEGSTKTTVPMPGPDEVLSFEMPPLRIPGGATVPDRLSIRVRLTREPMQEARPR